MKYIFCFFFSGNLTIWPLSSSSSLHAGSPPQKASENRNPATRTTISQNASDTSIWQENTVAFSLGTDEPTKTDEFLEKFQRGGGGHFQSKKSWCIFWTFNGAFWAWNYKRIATWVYEKEGGSKAFWNFSKNSSVLVWPPVPYVPIYR